MEGNGFDEWIRQSVQAIVISEIFAWGLTMQVHVAYCDWVASSQLMLQSAVFVDTTHRPRGDKVDVGKARRPADGAHRCECDKKSLMDLG
eukprot:scaffold216904_cov55-Attheya_sp.AAC.1